jgi:hypothetical protein
MRMEAKQEAGTIQKGTYSNARPRVAKGAVAARSPFNCLTAKPRAAADASRLFLCGCCVVASARGRWAVDDGAAVVLDRCTRARAGYYRRLPPYMLSERDGAAPYVLYVHPGSGYGGWLVRSPVK